MSYNYLLIFIAFLLVLYISFYFIFPDEVVIYQTDIINFDFNTLYTKQPIVIEDGIKDINKLLYLWFSPNIVNYDVKIDNLWSKNKYKYLLIHATDDNTKSEITLYQSSKNIQNSNIPSSDTYLTTIKLNNNKILIIPFGWRYNISGNVNIYGIHDYITYILQYLH